MAGTATMTAEEALGGLISDESIRANPYPAYETIRAAGKAYHSEIGFWFVTSYDGCYRLMRHPDLVRQHGDSWKLRGEMTGGLGRPWFDLQERFMLFLDPPDHTRIRSLVSRAFTPRYLAHLRPQIQERVDDLVDGLAAAGGGDLIADLALPLPMMVICDMLGVPADDRDSFRAWTSTLAGTLEPLPSPEVQDAADDAIVAFHNYFEELVEARRRDLKDDLLSRLIEVEQEGDKLDTNELIATAMLLLAAGFETTTNLIGNGTLGLLNNRAQWDLLVKEPERAPAAVEELLRYDSPVQLATPRIARTEVEIEGQTVEEGFVVVPVVGAANRDPDHFDHPADLDLNREGVVPLSFGGGPHFCLGASLARIEGAELFERLPQRVPTLDLAEHEPRWRQTMNLRGLEALAVTA